MEGHGPNSGNPGQAQMRRDDNNFLQETGSQVNNMLQGAADVGKGAAQGTVSLARGAVLGVTNLAQGTVDAVKNTVGSNQSSNSTKTATTNNPNNANIDMEGLSYPSNTGHPSNPNPRT